MALFNLTDIKFTKTDNRVVDLGAFRINNYSTSILKYPIDLGSTDKGHYMMIHVNVQAKTSYSANYALDTASDVQRQRTRLFNQTGALNTGGAINMVVDSIQRLAEATAQATPNAIKDAYKGFTNIAADVGDKIAKVLPPVVGESLEDFNERVRLAGVGAKSAILPLNHATFLRTTKRTTDSIALYMPDTLAFTENQTFDAMSLGGEPAALLSAGAAAVSSAFSGGNFDPVTLGRNVTPFVAQFLAKKISPIAGQNSTQAMFASLIGAVQNPLLEMLYSSPEFRSFQFQFMFYPRSEKEAIDVQKIIQRLKFHQAPEILPGTTGYFMVPPSEFDIEFYYNGEINVNIPKITTCVLTNMSVDYAPNGFRAYEVPSNTLPELGKTGMPFAIRLDLTFREVGIMTKSDHDFNEVPRGGGPDNRNPPAASVIS